MITFRNRGTHRHNDLGDNLYNVEHNILHNFTFNTDLRLNPKWKHLPASQTDLPRLRQGKVGGQVSTNTHTHTHMTIADSGF